MNHHFWIFIVLRLGYLSLNSSWYTFLSDTRIHHRQRYCTKYKWCLFVSRSMIYINEKKIDPSVRQILNWGPKVVCPPGTFHLKLNCKIFCFKRIRYFLIWRTLRFCVEPREINNFRLERKKQHWSSFLYLKKFNTISNFDV